jgi:hypothetical protein
MKNFMVTYRFPLLLTLLTIAMLAGMEASHPYFFLQDDNRTYHLPYHLHNLRALLDGELPLFNFNQYLGTPVSFLSAPFYPLNYLALLVSRMLLGHYFAAMEFIALFHLVVAVLGFFRFARGLELDDASSAFGAIAWGFSPFVITIGNSWIHTLGYAAWLPWILLFSLRQIDGYRHREFLALLAMRLLAFLLGYPQWFLYIATFDLLLVGTLYAMKKRQDSAAPCSTSAFLRCYGGNYLAFLVLSLPALLPLLREASLSVGRKEVLPWNIYTMYSYGFKAWLHGLLTPFLDGNFHFFGELHFVSHVGYLTLIFAVVALLHRHGRSVTRLAWLFAALSLFSFLWSADIGITRLFYYLPVYGKMRYPFKLQLFTGFFLVTLGTVGCSVLLDRIREKRYFPLVTVVMLLLHAANFLALYTLLPQKTLSTHLDVPPFVEPLQERFAGGRILSAGPDVVWDGERVVPGNTVPTLGYNFAMLWNLYHFGGYEALLAENNYNAALGLINNSIFSVPAGTALDFSRDVPLDYLRRWGVSWYVINRQVPLSGIEGLELVHSDRFRNVLHDPQAKPLVYWLSDGSQTGFAHRIGANCLKIETGAGRGGDLLVNFLFHPGFSATIDGNPLPIATTDDGQMVLHLPAGNHIVLLKYADRYFTRGLIIAVSCLLLVSIAAVVAHARARRIAKVSG